MANDIGSKRIAELGRNGYTVIPELLSADEIKAARDNMLRYFPSPQELAATPQRYAAILEEAEYQQIEFPFAGDALNNIATHPRIISFVETLLGDRDVILSQSAIWAKYAGTGSFEQPMHTDFEGNTLVYPRDDGAFRQLNMILYYTDVDETMGPTCVVPFGKQKQSLWPPFRPRAKYPELYRREKKILVSAGSALVFSMSTFHRASEMLADYGVRFTHHLVYRCSRYPFAGYNQWSRFGEKKEMRRFIEQATPRQREVIGFPAPGHPYWNKETLDGVSRRYPKMDMTPYRAESR
jgi:ectoine hydroxylase-related dioxygenase (phytanoyl-CoA dioxygenase family)